MAPARPEVPPLRSLLRFVKDLLGLSRLEARVALLEEVLYESAAATRDRSKRRWRAAGPTTDLTWGHAVTGDNFIARSDAHGAFGDGKVLLEIGPGYGRLPLAMLARRAPFARYLGVDISARNVEGLRLRIKDDRFEFIVADMEESPVRDGIDTVLSSLVFKHLYPSCERVLTSVAASLAPGGRCIFDLIEGDRQFFERDGVTYIRHYRRDEIHDIVRKSGLDLIAFDEVAHDPDHVRLLVIAGRPR